MNNYRHFLSQWPKILIALLFVILTWGLVYAATTLTNWPLWPTPAARPNYDYGPISFTYVNRDMLSYVEFQKPATDSDEYPAKYWWKTSPFNTVWETILSGTTFSAPSQIWGSQIHISKATNGNITTVTGSYPTTRKIFWGSSSPPQDLASANPDALATIFRQYSVIPKYISEAVPWFTLNGNKYDNQPFRPNISPNWLTGWLEFLKSTTSKAGRGMADSGHASPLLVWPDNTWLKGMDNFLSYQASMKASYSNWGEAVGFISTNEGLLHAFSTNAKNPISPYQEQWTFMPMPALQLGIYQKYLLETRDTTTTINMPRTTFLDGPITVHDVEISPGTWRRFLVGTTGVGSFLLPKEARVFTKTGEWGVSSTPDIASSNNTALGNAFGIYTIDVTSIDVPFERWSLSGINWPTKNENQVFKNGVELTSPGNFSFVKNIRRVTARPVIGYTRDNNGRKWHLLLAGIDTDLKNHIWDIDILTGQIIKEKTLSLELTPDLLLQDQVFPTRITPALPWGETSPLLTEVYIHFSNGDFFKVDLSRNFTDSFTGKGTTSNPKRLAYFSYNHGNASGGAASTTDFDVTFLNVSDDVTPHRFAAIAIQIGKPGWAGDGARNGLLVLDLTKLEKDYDTSPSKTYPYSVVFGPSTGYQPGTTNETISMPYGYVAFLIVDVAKEELDLLSSPIFYDGKIVFASVGQKETGPKPRPFYSRVYVTDPFAAGGTDLEPLVNEQTQIVGGAIIDTGGNIIAPRADGTTFSADLGLDPPGAGGGGSGNLPAVETLFWLRK